MGSIASLIGFPVAIWQIVKTRHIAEATKKATLKTQKAISHNLILSDISTSIKNIEQIKSYIRDNKYDLAQFRINDVISQLIQVQEVLKISDISSEINFDNLINILVLLDGEFDKRIRDNSVIIVFSRVNSQLNICFKELNRLLGKAKTFIEKR